MSWHSSRPRPGEPFSKSNRVSLLFVTAGVLGRSLELDQWLRLALGGCLPSFLHDRSLHLSIPHAPGHAEAEADDVVRAVDGVAENHDADDEDENLRGVLHNHETRGCNDA